MASASSYWEGSHCVRNPTTLRLLQCEKPTLATKRERTATWRSHQTCERRLLSFSSQYSHHLRPREWESSANCKNEGHTYMAYMVLSKQFQLGRAQLSELSPVRSLAPWGRGKWAPLMFLMFRLVSKINDCCFKAVNFKVDCYTKIGKWNSLK